MITLTPPLIHSFNKHLLEAAPWQALGGHWEETGRYSASPSGAYGIGRANGQWEAEHSKAVRQDWGPITPSSVSVPHLQLLPTSWGGRRDGRMRSRIESLPPVNGAWGISHSESCVTGMGCKGFRVSWMISSTKTPHASYAIRALFCQTPTLLIKGLVCIHWVPWENVFCFQRMLKATDLAVQSRALGSHRLSLNPLSTLITHTVWHGSFRSPLGLGGQCMWACHSEQRRTHRASAHGVGSSCCFCLCATGPQGLITSDLKHDKDKGG